MNGNSDVLALFHAQRGVARIAQLVDLGVDRTTIWRHRRKGTLIDLLPGVVRLASAPDTYQARVMAVQLQSAPEGYVSGFSAARMFGVPEMPRRRIFFTVPWRPPGQQAHCHQRVPLPPWAIRSESNWHCEDDVRLHDGYRLERPVSMLFTVAARCNDHRFARVADLAWKLGLFEPAEAQEYLDGYRGRGRSGVRRLERWLEATTGRARPMQSLFEIDVLDALRAAGLPEPEKQYALRLLSGEVIHLDLAWPDVQLAVEPGHSRWHDGDDDVERDRHRDNACGEVGWHVMRYSERARRDLRRMAAEIARTYRNRS